MPMFDGHGVRLCFEQQGSRTDPPIVLVHGFSAQLVHWPPAFLDALQDRGFRIVRLDNRDVGGSAKLDDLGVPDMAGAMAAAAAGTPVEPPYTLSDMASDVIRLLDHLGLADAHFVGVSMGGMIVQHLGFEHPDRVRSLTSIMSTSGEPSVSAPTPEAGAALIAQPEDDSREGRIEHQRKLFDIIGGPHHRSRDCGFGALAEAAVDRCWHPPGVARQMAAIMADGNRRERLAGISAPTLVIHGEADPLVPASGGEDTAAHVAGARLKLLPTMGHDLPEPLVEEIVETIAAFCAEVDAGADAGQEASA
jgi:pimeloyl-ACP methyl ester carboxylesterase